MRVFPLVAVPSIPLYSARNARENQRVGIMPEEEKRTRLPRDERAKKPPAMRLTERDQAIMVAIWEHEGLLSIEQIMTLFGMGETAAKRRLGLLYHNGYIRRRDKSNQHKIFKGGVYWLDKKGAEFVAAVKGYDDFKDFRYKKEPRFQLFNHDLTLNDFRIRLKLDCEALVLSGREGLFGSVEEWVSDYEFRQNPDTVTYPEPSIRGHMGSSVERKKEIVPDGYGHLIVPGTAKGNHFRVLIEVDMATETRKGQFGRDKVLPGVAYLKSTVYRDRFGSQSGRYLVLTTAERRLAYIKRQTEDYGGEGYFYFSTGERVAACDNIFTAPIWVADGKTEYEALLPHLAVYPER